MANARLTLADSRQMMIIRVLFGGAPIVYLLIIYMMGRPTAQTVAPMVVPYLFLALALLAVPSIPLVSRVWLSLQKQVAAPTDVRERASTLCVIRLSLAEACFVLGFAAYCLTFDYKLLYYFYPVGIVAMIIAWPTRERFDAIVRQLEEP